jgi:hypothetical protein
MHHNSVFASVLASVVAAYPLSAFGQQKAAPPPPPGASQHIAVTEGVFDLRLGEVKDLTDRRVTLTFPRRDNDPQRIEERDYIVVLINGNSWSVNPGKRTNLKNFDAVGKTFSDMTECYLDLLRLTVPRGGTPVAQFRFHCR